MAITTADQRARILLDLPLPDGNLSKDDRGTLVGIFFHIGSALHDLVMNSAAQTGLEALGTQIHGTGIESAANTYQSPQITLTRQIGASSAVTALASLALSRSYSLSGYFPLQPSQSLELARVIQIALQGAATTGQGVHLSPLGLILILPYYTVYSPEREIIIPNAGASEIEYETDPTWD